MEERDHLHPLSIPSGNRGDMQLVEGFLADNAIQIQGQFFPSACLVEDVDGIRLGIVPDLKEILPSWWTRIHSGGARYLASPHGEGWQVITMDRFLQMRDPEDRKIGASAGWVEMENLPTFKEFYFLLKKTAPRNGFVHLHAHSEFSALDGFSKVEEMVEAAVADQQPALAVTDHGVCAAHPQLQKEAKKAGIKPIFGIEANLVDDRHRQEREVLYTYNHLVMWAKTDEGLRNLWSMNTEAYREGFYGRPRMDWDTLSRFSEGVMASTACLRGPLAGSIKDGDEEATKETLGKLLNIFGDNLYLELQTNKEPAQELLNLTLASLGYEYGIPMIVAVDSHYPTLEDRKVHEVWIASQTNKDLTDEADLFSGDSHYHMMTEEEVKKALSYLPSDLVEEGMRNTVLVADRCNATIEGKSTPPVYSKAATEVEARQHDVERLVDLCLNNWGKCLFNKFTEEEYLARFEREMRLLVDKGFCGYFLMVADYVGWARKQGILVGPGRGSGSGSLVSYLAGITGIDPVETGLMFERFLTEGRLALPDFDVDFPASHRQAITDYIVGKYGEENVVRVGTQIRLKNKGVIRDLARTLKNTIAIHYPDIEAISKVIEEAEADKAGLGMSWEDLWIEAEEELGQWRDKYPFLFTNAERMVGRLKTYGKHAAGVVIAPDAQLTTKLPLRRSGAKDKELVAEFDMDSLEEFGFIKFDLLTLRTLDTIQMTVDLIALQTGEVIDVDSWREEYLDEMVWDELSAGHTLGVFQIETPGGTRFTKELKPQNLDQLADLLTLVRPGPLRSGLTETYLRRKRGDEAVSVIDPRLEPILETTFGCMIYQEQVLKICMDLAGYNETEADDVRKILGKKKVELVEEAGKEFNSRALANGTEERVAETIWGQMAEFARYSFNRSHAYGYAVLGYWCAWLKFHYPVQFLAASMSTVDKGRIPEFIKEARRMGFAVLPPDINLSGRGFAAVGNEIRYGFDGVKGIGSAVVDALMSAQPYTSYEDFIERKGAKANLGAVKLLARVGAFDSLVENRKALEESIEWETEGAADRCVHKDETIILDHGLPCVFDWDNEPLVIGKSGRPLKQKPLPKRCTKACRNFTPPEKPDFSGDWYTEDDIMEREMEMLGIYLSFSPFDRLPPDMFTKEIAPEVVPIKGSQIEDVGEGYDFVTVGLISRVVPYTAKNGKRMGFLGINAVDAEVDVTVFSDQWERYYWDLRIGNLCFFHLKKNERGLTLSHMYWMDKKYDDKKEG